jgi:hypothetical protein
MPCEGGWSCIHSLLQFDGESTNLEGLLSLLGWFGFLKAQVPKLVGDEVELAEGDLLARLHFFWFIAEVEDNSHLKHNISLYAKGPYLVRKLSDCFAPAITYNVIA